MHLELDHVFLAVSNGGVEAEQLNAVGFAEGPPNTHPGQGTACRRFQFENAYLELLWLENLAEALSPTIEPTGLALRAGGAPGTSRIGVCLRIQNGELGELPVASWEYKPPYLPEAMAISIAANSRLRHEPLLFFLPVIEARRRPEAHHANGARRITQVRITVCGPRGLSPELEWLSASDLVHIESGEPEALMMELDRGGQNETFELSGPTPLTLKW